MTAAARRDPEPHPLARGASPAVIGQWLLHEAALDDARASLDLARVHDVIEHWRGIAILQTDPTAYRRTMRRAAELATGEPSTDDEPLEITTSKVGLERMYGRRSTPMDPLATSINVHEPSTQRPWTLSTGLGVRAPDGAPCHCRSQR